MSYKEKPQLKLYKYENSSFVLQAIIDDYKECSFERNIYQAGQFSISINYNIPNASLFEKGLFVQFGNDPYDFGEILSINDSIGESGKGSQMRNIAGYDARYVFKRRVIKNLNANGTWQMTDKGELCMRNLILDQCGANAEEKRRLPIINEIPTSENALGKYYSVNESFSNLYETLKTIATQCEIGWRIKFINSQLSLEFYQGVNRPTVRFDTDFESLANGEFSDTFNSYANSIYVGGKGSGSERDIYEGEWLINESLLALNGQGLLNLNEQGDNLVVDGSIPNGLERYEAWDNQSAMTTEEEYGAEAISMLSQYGQTITVSGQGLAKSPYEYKKEYDVGDFIIISFSGKSAMVQILSVTEHWSKGNYGIEFNFGKPQNNLKDQLQLILRQIQKASDKGNSISSVKWYETPSETEMDSFDVTCDTLGFTGSGGSFKLYLNDEGAGAKKYNVYVKNLSGSITLTTDKGGSLLLNSGTYVTQIFVDIDGNILKAI